MGCKNWWCKVVREFDILQRNTVHIIYIMGGGACVQVIFYVRHGQDYLVLHDLGHICEMLEVVDHKQS